MSVLVLFVTIFSLAGTFDTMPDVLVQNSNPFSSSACLNSLQPAGGGYDTLHYDGNNATGIGMSGGGWFKTAVRFTAPYRCILKSILFYQFDYAMMEYMFIYGPGSSTQPGTVWDSVLYEPSAPRSWVSTAVPNEYFVPAGTDFWAGPQIPCPPNRYPVGVDSGPLVPDRNFIYWDERIGWVQVDRIGVPRNWNIRAVVARAESRDVCPTAVLAPTSQIWPGPVVPKVSVRNIGEQAESNIPVAIWIDSAGRRVYEETTVLAGPLAPRGYGVVSFPTWFPGSVGAEYRITVFTSFAADLNHANDTITTSVRVAGAAFSDTLVARRVVGAPPSIDGRIEAAEWLPARAFDISDTAGQGLVRRPPGSSTVRFLYDEHFLYLACEFPTVTERQDGDFFAVCMDEDRSGNWNRIDSSEGRHTVFYTSGQDSVIFEAILNTLPYMWRLEGQCPGAFSTSSTAGGHLQFEAKIPLGLRRGDLSLLPGDTASVFIYAMAGNGSDCYGWWPQRVTQGEWARPALYGPLVLSTEVGVGEGRGHKPAQPFRLEILPNPARDKAVICLPYRAVCSELQVVDAAGRIVARQPVTGASVELDLRRLAGGVYLIRLEPGLWKARLVVLE